MHTYSYAPHDQNDKHDRFNALYDCDDWYFSTLQSSMPLESHWQSSNWVGLIGLGPRYLETLCTLAPTMECFLFILYMNGISIFFKDYSDPFKIWCGIHGWSLWYIPSQSSPLVFIFDYVLQFVNSNIILRKPILCYVLYLDFKQSLQQMKLFDM